jgi:hypothetical protein
LAKDVSARNEYIETLLAADKDIGVEADEEEMKYIFVWCSSTGIK